MGPTLLALLLAGLPTPQRALSDVPPISREDAAPILFHGGRVHVGDEAGTVVEALLVVDGRVVAIGSERELLARSEHELPRRVDLGGGVAVPGLQDAHVRLREAGCAPYFVELEGCRDFRAVIQRVLAHAASTPAGDWIEARGLSRAVFPPGELPGLDALSAALPDHPVVLRAADGEVALLNAAAMRRARITFTRDGFPRIDGGRIPKDEHGRQTGLLFGNAVRHLDELLPARHPGVLAQCLLRAQERLLARGVTCAHVMGADRELLTEIERLRAGGLWKLRIAAWMDGTDEIDAALVKAWSPARPEGDSLSIIGVHLRVDGTIAWGGEALLADARRGSRHGADLRTSPAPLSDRLRAAARMGLAPALEAHGDRATRIALDLVQSIGLLEPGLRGLRPRIEGADLVTPRDWERFPELGVVASIQPQRTETEMAWLDPHLPGDRARAARVWWALAPELGSYAFGSAWPATGGDLLAALALARQAHEPAAGKAEDDGVASARAARRALAGFTIRAAEAAHQEATRGRLMPGYAADMTVLDVDPLECTSAELARASVLMSVIDGEVVYRARGD